MLHEISHPHRSGTMYGSKDWGRQKYSKMNRVKSPRFCPTNLLVWGWPFTGRAIWTPTVTAAVDGSGWTLSPGVDEVHYATHANCCSWIRRLSRFVCTGSPVRFGVCLGGGFACRQSVLDINCDGLIRSPTRYSPTYTVSKLLR